MRKLFGKQLRHLRRMKDMTQQDLAAKIGTTRPLISNWERGVNFPEAYNLDKLQEVFPELFPF